MKKSELIRILLSFPDDLEILVDELGLSRAELSVLRENGAI